MNGKSINSKISYLQKIEFRKLNYKVEVNLTLIYSLFNAQPCLLILLSILISRLILFQVDINIVIWMD